VAGMNSGHFSSLWIGTLKTDRDLVLCHCAIPQENLCVRSLKRTNADKWFQNVCISNGQKE
jgi:hypothetical protein